VETIFMLIGRASGETKIVPVLSAVISVFSFSKTILLQKEKMREDNACVREN